MKSSDDHVGAIDTGGAVGMHADRPKLIAAFNGDVASAYLFCKLIDIFCDGEQQVFARDQAFCSAHSLLGWILPITRPRNASFDLAVSTSAAESDILTIDQHELAHVPLGLQNVAHTDAESGGTRSLEDDAGEAILGVGL